jgi:hypothetical protein
MNARHIPPNGRNNGTAQGSFREIRVADGQAGLTGSPSGVSSLNLPAAASLVAAGLSGLK